MCPLLLQQHDKRYNRFCSTDVSRALQNRQLPYVQSDSYVSPAPIRLSHGTDDRDETAHMGKVKTRVIIKQLTGCLNDSPSQLRHPWPSLSAFAPCHLVFSRLRVRYVWSVTVIARTPQGSINVPSAKSAAQSPSCAHAGEGDEGLTRGPSSSSLAHLSDSFPLIKAPRQSRKCNTVGFINTLSKTE